jgi:hypothetical protein
MVSLGKHLDVPGAIASPGPHKPFGPGGLPGVQNDVGGDKPGGHADGNGPLAGPTIGGGGLGGGGEGG